MKKILIMCEGPNELKVVNLLLDHGKLKFSRDDLLDMRPFHARQLASPQLKPALDAYHGELEIYRIGDKMSDALKIPKELSSEIKTQKKFCTKPDLKFFSLLQKTGLPILKRSSQNRNPKTSASKIWSIIAESTIIPPNFTTIILATESMS